MRWHYAVPILPRTCYIHIRDLCRLRPKRLLSCAQWPPQLFIPSSITAITFSTVSTLLKWNTCKQSKRSWPSSHENSQTSPHNYRHKISLHWLKVPQILQYKIVSLTYNSSNLSTLLYSPITHHPTAWVYMLCHHHNYLSLSRTL